MNKPSRFSLTKIGAYCGAAALWLTNIPNDKAQAAAKVLGGLAVLFGGVGIRNAVAKNGSGL